MQKEADLKAGLPPAHLSIVEFQPHISQSTVNWAWMSQLLLCTSYYCMKCLIFNGQSFL